MMLFEHFGWIIILQYRWSLWQYIKLLFLLGSLGWGGHHVSAGVGESMDPELGSYYSVAHFWEPTEREAGGHDAVAADVGAPRDPEAGGHDAVAADVGAPRDPEAGGHDA
ncbi:hypothetical protein XENORESO_010611, partial [Xenotaenia resolanae]